MHDGATSVLICGLAVASSPEESIEALLELSTMSVVIAVFALTIVVALGFGIVLHGFVRVIARR